MYASTQRVEFQVITLLESVKNKERNESSLHCFGKPVFELNLCQGQILLFELNYPVISVSR